MAYPTYHDVINCNGKEYLVVKNNPKKCKAVDLKTGKIWNIPYEMATVVRKGTAADIAKQETITDKALHLGQPVMFNSYPKEAGIVFVVIGIGCTGVKLARMFGSEDRFYRNVQPSALNVLEHKDVISALIK
jgi:hypothetical protein